jgi:hypothetical protein
MHRIVVCDVLQVEWEYLGRFYELELPTRERTFAFSNEVVLVLEVVGMAVYQQNSLAIERGERLTVG